MKWDHYLTPFTKMNSKWNKDLNVIPEIIKLLEINKDNKLLDIGLGNDFFFNLTLKSKATKAKTTAKLWGSTSN